MRTFCCLITYSHIRKNTFQNFTRVSVKVSRREIFLMKFTIPNCHTRAPCKCIYTVFQKSSIGWCSLTNWKKITTGV